MEGVSNGVLNVLADLFFRLGPFFLALFLPLVILTKARAWYNDAVVRQNPPATEEEKQTYRFYFLGSVAASAVVFSLSLLAWWLLNMARDHTYQVAILDIPQNVNLDSRYFYRDSFRQTLAGSMARDKYFLIDQPGPFKANQKFLFDYYVQTQTSPSLLGKGTVPIHLSIEYRGKSSESFHVAIEKGRPALVRDDSDSGSVVVASKPASVARLADTGATPDSDVFEIGSQQ